MWFRLLNAVGLDDGKDGMSFNKLVTAVLTATVIYAVIHGIEVGTHLTVLAMAVLFGGFGLKGLSLFANMYRRTEHVSLTGDLTDAAKVVTSRFPEVKS